jgi:hypothetical protein
MIIGTCYLLMKRQTNKWNKLTCTYELVDWYKCHFESIRKNIY